MLPQPKKYRSDRGQQPSDYEVGWARYEACFLFVKVGPSVDRDTEKRKRDYENDDGIYYGMRLLEPRTHRIERHQSQRLVQLVERIDLCLCAPIH